MGECYVGPEWVKIHISDVVGSCLFAATLDFNTKDHGHALQQAKAYATTGARRETLRAQEAK